ncbi:MULTISPECIES: hypothetical protein [unclassified Micromonospora]|uniref:hypothetical protein n=1 Tax=Micromonospora TaxID=1873 RepID=UPI0018909EC9|nr:MULTISPECIES: hypothetical protein [unclassified Micromonospora]MBF5029984.1 hypothetical protein [Micromonospora sp. ANENR4]WBC05577.1 hypothetical protein O7546_11650 [Micromonospora sp. WMMA1976]
MTGEPAGARTNGTKLTVANGRRPATDAAPAARTVPVERADALLSAVADLVGPRADPLGDALAAVLDAARDLVEVAARWPAGSTPGAESHERLRQAHGSARAACSVCWYAVVEVGDQVRRADGGRPAQ